MVELLGRGSGRLGKDGNEVLTEATGNGDTRRSFLESIIGIYAFSKQNCGH